ncbi:MAG TPA: type II toxin-antitoxin system RelE/ParE family toxin [Planctomycetota bacterium]|nr:type II toxin-antitoxin system RelE/ParE family toxin [Planctomycetota bacterium]
MTLSFHPEAAAELEAATAAYEDREPGLGLDFILEVQAAIERIVSFPEAWPILDGEVRRCLVHRFPFGILYACEASGIRILAVMHLHREPEYWKHRRGPTGTV